jgi:hypothetical protein
MTSKRIVLAALSIAAIATLMLVANVLNVNAQSATGTPKALQGAKEVTMTGRVVDLQCFMTGEFPSADVTKCTTDCIRAGVPAGLNTSKGLIILGQGTAGPAKILLPFANQDVQVRGKLYEKDGSKYLDISSVQKPGEHNDE